MGEDAEGKVGDAETGYVEYAGDDPGVEAEGAWKGVEEVAEWEGEEIDGEFGLCMFISVCMDVLGGGGGMAGAAWTAAYLQNVCTNTKRHVQGITQEFNWQVRKWCHLGYPTARNPPIQVLLYGKSIINYQH